MTTIEARPRTTGATEPVERLLSALDARQPGRSLPGPLYADPDLHELDLNLLWSRQWILVGSVAEIREPGDYFVVELGRASVIVLRDDDEQVGAFRNVCRHRGSRLLTDSHGSVGNIVCGYHSWTYGTDGRLLHAPQLRDGVDPACLGLGRVHVREIGGLIFVCLAAEAPADLDDVAATITPYLMPHRLDRTKVAAQIDLVEGGNWKLTMENNRECYHCEGGHPELLCTFFPTYGLTEAQIPPRLRAAHDRFLLAEAELNRVCEQHSLPSALVQDLADRPVGFRIAREPLDRAGESFSRDGSRMVGRLLGDLTEPRLGRCTLHTQPNGWVHLLADHAVTFTALPLAVDRTLVRTTWLVHEDAVEGVDYDLDTLTEVWRHTNEQDATFVTQTQHGVTDPAYVPGPYTEPEQQVDDFVSWYVARMREAVAR